MRMNPIVVESRGHKGLESTTTHALLSMDVHVCVHVPLTRHNRHTVGMHHGTKSTRPTLLLNSENQFVLLRLIQHTSPLNETL